MVSANMTGYVNPRVGQEDVVCRFGNAWVNGALIGPGVVECTSPPAPRMDGMTSIGASLDVPFALSMNGGADVAPSHLTFSYIGDVRVRAVEPARGSTSGGTAVAITGDNLHLATDCAFGQPETALAAYSYRDRETDALVCVTPAVDRPQRVELRLRTALGWVPTRMQFVYEKEWPQQKLSTGGMPDPADFPISMLSIIPALGPSTGGTSVNVALNTASRSLSNATMLCWFDDTATMAEVLADGSVSCLSAPTFIEGEDRVTSVDMTMTVDGVVANGVLPFTYYQLRQSDLTGLSPTSIDAKGGSLVRIDCGPAEAFDQLVTNGFLDDIVVRVGQSIISAEYDNASNEITFVSPAFDDVDVTKILDVSLSLNGGADFVAAPPLQVYPSPALFSVAPSAVELGRSGTIEIAGSHFVAFEDAHCRVGDAKTHAVVQSTKRILCDLPDDVATGRAMPGVLPVTVSLNGIDYVEDVLTITVEDGVVVKGILSSFASELGGTNVTLVGRNFHLLDLHRGFIALGDEGRRVIPHTTNETHAILTVPAGTGEEGISVALGATSVPIDTGLKLRYLPPVTIDGAQPPFGAAGGGYSVAIFGTFHAEFEYVCEIATTDGLPLASVHVSVTRNNSAECEMPPMPVIGPVSINILRIADVERSNPIASLPKDWR